MMEENRRWGSYYAVLGVRPDASCSEIRSAYRKLAMKWHPDRCGREPWAVDEAKRRFQQIQEAYQVLSDEGKRTLYDAGLYDPFEEDEEVEGFSDFVKEMVNLMSNVRKEGTLSQHQDSLFTPLFSKILVKHFTSCCKLHPNLTRHGIKPRSKHHKHDFTATQLYPVGLILTRKWVEKVMK